MTDKKTELKRSGNRHLAKRSYRDAESDFRQLIEIAPEQSSGYSGLANVLARTDRHEVVIDLLEPVVDQLGSGAVLRHLAEAYRVLAMRGRKEYIDPAVRRHEEYRQIREDPVMLFYAAKLLQRKGDIEEAAEHFRRSWELDPRSRDAYQGLLACLKDLGRLDEVDKAEAEWRSRSQ